MDLTVRPAAPADLDAIVDVFRRCWTISYAELLPPSVQEEMTPEKARELWASAVLPSFERTTLIAEADGKVIGMARIGTDPSDATKGHLFSLYIDPAASGKGAGRRLLTSAMDEVRGRGFSLMTLWVFKANSLAQGLYNSCGFNPTSLERTDDRWTIPEIEMIATIN